MRLSHPEFYHWNPILTWIDSTLVVQTIGNYPPNQRLSIESNNFFIYDRKYHDCSFAVAFCVVNGDVIMSARASQITGVSIIYWAVCTGAHQRKHQRSASLAIVLPFDDVILRLKLRVYGIVFLLVTFLAAVGQVLNGCFLKINHLPVGIIGLNITVRDSQPLKRHRLVKAHYIVKLQ